MEIAVSVAIDYWQAQSRVSDWPPVAIRLICKGRNRQSLQNRQKIKKAKEWKELKVTELVILLCMALTRRHCPT